MNFSLLDSILCTNDGVLVTITGARGHTYKKTGQKALYAPGRLEPLYGNLGALCADQEIVARAAEVRASRKPLVITIDTTRAMDELVGSGTACGGELDLLLEPVDLGHKRVYARLEPHLKAGPPAFLVHEIDTGELRLEDKEPSRAPSRYVEKIEPLVPLVLFGATPLARRIASLAADMAFVVHLVDWRPAFLDLFRGLPGLEIHAWPYSPRARACAVVMSHAYERDIACLRDTLRCGCRYVGLLSSRNRRDRMFDALASEGIPREHLARVHSPVGLAIGAESDGEIAVSIMAEIIGFVRS